MAEIKATSNDRVIFTSLKPMSELNLSNPVLLYHNSGISITGIFFDENHVICDGVMVDSKEFIGWQHIPGIDLISRNETEEIIHHPV